MENTGNEIKYSILVPLSNPIMVSERKKQGVLYGVVLFLCSLFMGVFTVMSAISENSSVAVVVIFALAAAACIACGIYFLCKNKSSDKENAKSYTFNFYNVYLEINQDDSNKKTSKNLTRCLYGIYKDKQYISKIIEDKDKFEIKIYTGTYNLVPQYKKFTLPKDVVNSTELEEFKQFLKKSVGNNYFIKQ